MLTDTIMYDCIEYLLRDKNDEESLECLCRFLRTIGKELDAKANEKSANRLNLEKHYKELDNIVREQKTSARIRFMIIDLVELRQVSDCSEGMKRFEEMIDLGFMGCTSC